MKIVQALSGGLDSETVLSYLINQGHEVHCLNFTYGSKHNKYECESAKQIAKYYNVPYRLIDLTKAFVGFKSNLLQSGGAIPEGHYEADNMSLTVVPGRNTIFSAILMGYAESIDGDGIALGVHLGDHCIPASEYITTSRGKISMESLKEGDLALSQNKDTGKISFKPVIEKVNNGFRKDIYQIITKGGRTARLTSNHKVHQIIRSNYNHHKGWDKTCIETPLNQLKPDDWVLTPITKEVLESSNSNEIINSFKYGDAEIIQIKEIVKSDPEIVYDITVEDNHNFFVGTGSGILVSNSVYPDCRKEYIKALDTLVYLASNRKVEVLTPFINTDKAGIVKEGLKLKVPYELSRTCYKDQPLSCGLCGSCNERLEAFALNNVKDPIKYSNN